MAESVSLVHLDFPVEKILSGDGDNLLKSASSIILYNYLALEVFLNYATVFFLQYYVTVLLEDQDGPGLPLALSHPEHLSAPVNTCKLLRRPERIAFRWLPKFP